MGPKTNGAVGGGISALMPVALIEVTSFSSKLETVDEFLDVGLFLGLMAISLAAGSLMLSAADQRYQTALAATAFNRGMAAEQQRQGELLSIGAKYFLLAFIPTLLGVLSCIGFDGFLDSPEQTGVGVIPLGVQNLMAAHNGELVDEFLEAIASSAFLGASLVMMFFGFFRALPGFNLNRDPDIH